MNPPIRIAPPEPPTAIVSRLELRTALRKIKKFARKDTEFVHLYVAENLLVVEGGVARMKLEGEFFWEGCVTVSAPLILAFWNALPKGKTIAIQYDQGYVCLGSLKLGVGHWQPKYDPDWMDAAQSPFMRRE